MGSVGANKNTAPKPFSFEGLSSGEIKDKISELQGEMGQTGYEAGNPNTNPDNKLYVNTGKSMNINAYLLSDGKSFYSDGSNWNNLISEPWIKNAIKQIDKGMKPLSQDIQTYRFLNSPAFGKMVGLNGLKGEESMNKFFNQLENSEKIKNDFTNLLKNVDYTHKAYTSTTYVPEHGTYGDKDVRFNIIGQKGTNAIITNNHKEHEILFGRNVKYQFTGGWHIETSKGGKKQLVIDVRI